MCSSPSPAAKPTAPVSLMRQLLRVRSRSSPSARQQRRCRPELRLCGSPVRAASVGTVGIVSPRGESYGALTTPDPVELHRSLDALVGDGVSHLAIEASSHGLDQYRLDG